MHEAIHGNFPTVAKFRENLILILQCHSPIAIGTNSTI